MKNFIKHVNGFIKECGPFEVILLWYAGVSAGVMWGMAIPKRARKASSYLVVSIFCAAYLGIVLKVLRFAGILNLNDSKTT